MATAMSDVLTEDEESALSIVRETLAEARAKNGAADIRGLSTAIAAVGPRMTAETVESSSFVHRTARFTVRALLQRSGAFELSFQAPEQ